jgi:hypothetical protein
MEFQVTAEFRPSTILTSAKSPDSVSSYLEFLLLELSWKDTETKPNILNLLLLETLFSTQGAE